MIADLEAPGACVRDLSLSCLVLLTYLVTTDLYKYSIERKDRSFCFYFGICFLLKCERQFDFKECRSFLQ